MKKRKTASAARNSNRESGTRESRLQLDGSAGSVLATIIKKPKLKKILPFSLFSLFVGALRA